MGVNLDLAILADKINKGKVSDSEISELEDQLIKLYIAKAEHEGKKIVKITDPIDYQMKKESEEAYQGKKFYMLIDKNGKVADMSVIAYHLADTEQGLLYHRITVMCEDLREQKQHEDSDC